MSFPSTMPPRLLDLKKGNVVQWMQNARTLYNPLEQARWNQSNIDSLFYAGEQRYINTYFQFYPVNNFQNFQFNLIQQPVNMVTGYQRQHRKNINYVPVVPSKQEMADDLTKIETYANSYRRRLEKFSLAFEYAAITGMCLIQPYLDFKSDDPINGVLDLAVWPYNSFFIDPFFRDYTELSDCNFIWTQKFLSKEIALQYFKDDEKLINSLTGYNTSSFSFYFMPENYNAVRNNFLVLSQIWYQTTRKKKALYNEMDGLVYDFYDDEKYINEAVKNTGFFQVIEMEVSTWNVAVVLNNHVMYNGHNPLKFDRCPFIPVYWNLDNQLSQPDLRCRSLIRPMRDVQFLMNRRIIINHDISESSINSGWKRMENAVVNEDDLKYSGQGKDIIIKYGCQMTDVEKIQPNAVPASDMELANQLADLIFKTSGVNQELMGMASDSKTGIESMLKQGAGLVTLQKYFDQADVALKQMGLLDQDIMQYNWSSNKIANILGKEPNLEFRTKIFSKHNVLVEEGLNTTIQQQNQFIQIMQLNEAVGGIIPPKFILQNSVIQGKNEIIEAVEAQEKAQAEAAQQEMMLKQTLMEAQLQNLQAKSVAEIGLAKERVGRADSNIGLLSERISEIAQNNSISLKNKIEALQKLIEIINAFGQPEVDDKMEQVKELEEEDEAQEAINQDQVKKSSEANDFIMKLLAQKNNNGIMNPNQQQGQ